MDCNQIEILMAVDDVARADILLAEDRNFYRFATADSLEQGDFTGLRDQYDSLKADLLAAAVSAHDEKIICDPAFKVVIAVDGVKVDTSRLSEQALRRIVGILHPLDPSLGFLLSFL